MGKLVLIDFPGFSEIELTPHLVRSESAYANNETLGGLDFLENRNVDSARNVRIPECTAQRDVIDRSDVLDLSDLQ